MIEELKQQVRVVAGTRRAAKMLFDARVTSMAEWEKHNKELLDDLRLVSQDVIEEEGKLRELTLKAYAETGDKKPAFGVGIREVTKLEYDGKVAFDWAIGHKMALKLDTRAFEKIAKADTPDFVEIITEPQATIATNLEEEEE